MKKLLALFFLVGALLLIASCSDVKGKSDTPIEELVVEESAGDLANISADVETGEEMEDKEITAESSEDSVTMLSLSDFSAAKAIDSIEGKGLNEFDTAEITAEVFFETDASIRSSILANEGILYFGNESCEFYAVEINTKQQLWKYTTEEAVQSLPVFSNEMIIFNAGNTLYGLSSENGDEIFKVTHASAVSKRLSNEDYTYNEAGAVVSDGIAYYNALNGDLVAVDIAIGDIIWTVPAVYEGVAGSGANFYEGKLYWVDTAGILCCADINTQEMVFMFNIRDKIYGPMHINDGKIYIAGRNCRLYCIDAESGNLIWASFADDQTTWFSGGSVCAGDIVYTGTSDRRAIFSFDKNTGEFNRIYSTEANVYTQPVLNGDNLIITATDVYSLRRSFIMEFDTENHTKLWRAYIEDAILSSPAVYDGTVFFGSDSGNVYYVDLK